MAIIVLTSAGGSPGVTSTALGLSLTWPRPVLLADCDRHPNQAVLAGYLRGLSAGGRGLGGLVRPFSQRHPQGQLPKRLLLPHRQRTGELDRPEHVQPRHLGQQLDEFPHRIRRSLRGDEPHRRWIAGLGPVGQLAFGVTTGVQPHHGLHRAQLGWSDQTDGAALGPRTHQGDRIHPPAHRLLSGPQVGSFQQQVGVQQDGGRVAMTGRWLRAGRADHQRRLLPHCRQDALARALLHADARECPAQFIDGPPRTHHRRPKLPATADRAAPIGDEPPAPGAVELSAATRATQPHRAMASRTANPGSAALAGQHREVAGAGHLHQDRP